MYYYRDKDAREIDIVLEHDGILNPLEIKKTLIQVPNSLKYEIASGDGKTKNILARLGKKGGRVLILNGHCDTGLRRMLPHQSIKKS